MKRRLAILPLIFFCTLVHGQDLGSIVVQTWSHNEPPTQPGPHIFEIEYQRNKADDFEAKFYTVTAQKSKRIRLNEILRIPKEDIETFLNWYDNVKTTFKLDELGTDGQELNNSTHNASYKPDFPIENDLLIKIDTFNYCNEYQFKQSISTGGYEIKVLLVIDNKRIEFFSYDSDDRGQHKFDLKGYLYLQPVLENQIPIEFKVHNLFSRKTLLNNLFYYKKVTECEGFYYQEFIKANPDRTVQQNRMMVGWDFEKYMNERNKK